MKERIIQFGEGNFLRAFADAFVDSLNKGGLFDGSVVIIKPTNRGNLDKFKAQNNKYNLVIRGLEKGKTVSQISEINCISRCINPYEAFDEYISLAKNKDIRFIISNTTEAGIEFDESCLLSDKPALSFPAKLTQLLFARYKAGLGGFIILPCELIDKNADMLKDCVLKYAKLWKLEDGFFKWLESENTFCNTLVDRIVTGYPSDDAQKLCEKIGYDDLLLDAAEPYHLWAIEGNAENELPLKKGGFNVIWTQDITPLKKRKVRLLNGAHTVMVFPALLCGIESVGDCFRDEDIKAFLESFLNKVAISVLGDTAENREYALAVLERFQNPFIVHKLTSIALNSVSKFSVRVLPSALDFKNQNGYFPKTAAFSLASLIYYYKNNEPNDDVNTIEFIKNNSVNDILKSDVFKEDISEMLPDVLKAYEYISGGNIREGLKWAIS